MKPPDRAPKTVDDLLELVWDFAAEMGDGVESDALEDALALVEAQGLDAYPAIRQLLEAATGLAQRSARGHRRAWGWHPPAAVDAVLNPRHRLWRRRRRLHTPLGAVQARAPLPGVVAAERSAARQPEAGEREPRPSSPPAQEAPPVSSATKPARDEPFHTSEGAVHGAEGGKTAPVDRVVASASEPAATPRHRQEDTLDATLLTDDSMATAVVRRSRLRGRAAPTVRRHVETEEVLGGGSGAEESDATDQTVPVIQPPEERRTKRRRWWRRQRWR